LLKDSCVNRSECLEHLWRFRIPSCNGCIWRSCALLCIL